MRSRITNAALDGCVFVTAANDTILSLATTSNFTIPSPANGTDQIAPGVIALNSTSTSINIVLPAAPGGIRSAKYVVQNASSGTCNHTVQDPTGPTTVGVLAKGEIGIFFSVGTTWYGFTVPAGTNYVDGVTPGTVTASKAVIVDSASSVTGFGTVTAKALNANASGSTNTISGNVQLGSTSANTLGFYGTTPVALQTGANQASNSNTGAITAVTTTAPTSSSPYGYASGQAQAIITAVNSLITQANVSCLQGNAIQLALLNMGLIRGS